MIRVEVDVNPLPADAMDDNGEMPVGGIQFLTRNTPHLTGDFALDVASALRDKGITKPHGFVRVFIADEPDSPSPADVAELVVAYVSNG